MIGIYDANNNLISAGIQSAFETDDILEIKNRTLDGKWHVQSIGTGASMLTVKAHLLLAEKADLDANKRLTADVKIIFDDMYYIGIIDGAISYERQAFAVHPIFNTEFTLLVNEKGVA